MYVKEFQLASENILTVSVSKPTTFINALKACEEIPEEVLWHSVLMAFQSCTDFEQLKEPVHEINEYIPPLPECVVAEFRPESDLIDCVAQVEIPLDGPVHLKAILTDGDGNCLTRSLSKGYFNSDCKHLQLRARIIIESVIHMDKYLSHQCLERGASYVHGNATDY